MNIIYKTLCVAFTVILTSNVSAQHTTKLLGVTSKGGNLNLGTIYQYDLGSQSQSVNYNNTKTNGKYALAALTENGSGKLYGVTSSSNSNGGVIYEVNPSTNVYTPKYELTGGNNGFGFVSKLVWYNNEFYGTAGGGPNLVTFGITTYGAGVIFKWNPITNVYTKLADFDQTLGGLPTGNLAVYNNKMYGVNYFGGTSSNGSIYEFDPSTNVISKKYDFASSSLFNPSGGLLLSGGSLFGITNKGGINNLGVIYEWNPSTLSFNIRNNFDIPSGYIAEGSFTEYNTNLYCLMGTGGALGLGTLVEYNPSTFVATKLIDFGGSNGGSPAGDLLVYSNELYGAAKLNGTNNFGTIFKYNVTSTLLTKLYDFTGLNGANPYSNFMAYNNKFYAAALVGGTANGGVVYSFDPSTNLLNKIEDLDGTEGSHGVGSLITYNNKFYGIDSLGGEFSKGVIYEFDIQTGTFINLHSFDGTNGQNPNGELTVYNNKFYGTTKSGGSNSIGVLYEYNPTTSIFTKRFDFTVTVGSKPVGKLTEFGGKLYGCANIGGTANRGTIFEFNTSTNVTIVKANLSNINGGNPNSGMVLFSNNKMYGTTENGGQLSGVSGVLFEYTPGSITYSAKVNFNTATGLGNKPHNELAIYGNKVYGATRNVGLNGNGTLYKYEPSTNTATKLLDFSNASTGSKANGLYGINGKLYGTCMEGGSNALGTLFEVDTLTNILTVKHNFGGLSGETPIGGNLISVANPNYIPVFSNIPATNNGCNNINGESIFNITDADNDPLTFTLSSSNTALIPSANLSIVNISGSQYKLIYTPISGQTGSSNVSVTANDGFGGNTMATISVNVYAAPLVTASSSVPNACVGSPVTLNGGGASTYVWDNGVIDNTPFNLAGSTTYIVTGTDANNCSNTAQVTVIANALPIITITPSSTSVCAGGTLTLNSSGVLTPTWDNGVVEGQLFIPSSTLTYTVSGSDANGCSNTNAISIPFNPLPTIAITPSATAVCTGLPVTLASSGAVTYVWDNGVLEGQAFNPVATNTYTVTGTDANNCSNTNTVIITVNPLPAAPIITGSLPNPVCVNTSVTLSAANAGGTVNWTGPNSFSATGSSVVINVTANETYDATETESVNGCISPIGSYSIVSDPCLGIANNTKNKFLLSIVPNPTKQFVNIKTDKQIEKTSIYNALGKKVFTATGNNKTLDVSQLSQGMYTFECFIEGKAIQQKLIIE
jgi:uncharacterized repeat protein (TIGR03803 family)